MSNKDFLPTTDDQLIQWATQFISIASADVTVIGLTNVQLTDFTTAKNDLQTGVSTAKTAKDAAIAATANKKTKRKALVTNARTLARIVQSKPGVTDQKKRDLGLPIRQKPGDPVNVYTPLRCAATGITRTTNEISWETGGNHPGTLYEIYCMTAPESWEYLTTVTATLYRHKNILPGLTYSYQVRAMRSDVRSAFSNITSVGVTGEGILPGLNLKKAA